MLTHRTIYRADLHQMDVQLSKLLYSVVGPPAGMDRNLLWQHVLHHWNERVGNLVIQARIVPSSGFCLQPHGKFAAHVATLPECSWLKRVLSWFPIPRHCVELGHLVW